MVARLSVLLFLIVLSVRGVPAIDTVPIDASRPPLPTRITGVEIEDVKGWFANIYPWKYVPGLSTVYPVRSLWASPNDYQSPGDIASQNALLAQYGSGADVLEYSANPDAPDHNHWLRTYFTNGDRPFFVAYEHVFGTRHGPKDMSLRYNREAFKSDIDAIVRKAIIPFQHRYVTYHGRAVIFLWATSAMYGDFASLLDEIRAQYPVAFIGSIGLMQLQTEPAVLRNFSALDGFMEYGLYASSYDAMTNIYAQNSAQWRQVIRGFESATGRKYLFIPTFQAAFDNSKYTGGEGIRPMYPESRAEVVHHAERIKEEFGTVFDPLGPFVVFSELFEGAAVIESQCISDTFDKRGRWVGCGTGRLDILQKYFGAPSANDDDVLTSLGKRQR
jgi:hypothetical protein